MKKTIVLLGLIIIFFVPCKAQWKWVKNVWDSNTNWGNSVCTDVSGNCYTAGGSGMYSAGGGDKAFVMKNNAAGNLMWYKESNADIISDREGYGVCADAFSHIYVTGSYNNRLPFTFGGVTLSDSNSAYTNAFLLKMDLNGNVIWAKRTNGSGAGFATGVVADPSGNVYISGSFNLDSIYFGSYLLRNTTPFTALSHSAGFIVKYDSLGNVGWAIKTSDSLFDYYQNNYKITIGEFYKLNC